MIKRILILRLKTLETPVFAGHETLDFAGHAKSGLLCIGSPIQESGETIHVQSPD